MILLSSGRYRGLLPATPLLDPHLKNLNFLWQGRPKNRPCTGTGTNEYRPRWNKNIYLKNSLLKRKSCIKTKTTFNNIEKKNIWEWPVNQCRNHCQLKETQITQTCKKPEVDRLAMPRYDNPPPLSLHHPKAEHSLCYCKPNPTLQQAKAGSMQETPTE